MPDYFKTVILNEYKELYSGIGKLDGEINITQKASAVWSVAPVWRVGHYPSRTVKNELDKLVKQGIIVPFGIDKPTEWCNSFVCVWKPNGKIRLYLDPTQRNKYIVCPHHDAKLVEELLPKLSGVKISSIADACLSFLWWHWVKN